MLHTHNPKPGLYGRVVGRLARVPIVVNTCHGLYYGPDDSLAKRTILLVLEGIAARFSDAELRAERRGPRPPGRLARLPPAAHPAARQRRRPRPLPTRRPDGRRARPPPRRRARRPRRPDRGGHGRPAGGREGPARAVRRGPGRLDDRYVVVVVGPDDPAKPDALDRATIGGAPRPTACASSGMRDDVDRLYGAMDLFVLPSWREGFPRAAMEAAASGLPVIASDVRGCRQVVDDERDRAARAGARRRRRWPSAISALGERPRPAGRRWATAAVAAGRRRVRRAAGGRHRARRLPPGRGRKGLDRVVRALDVPAAPAGDDQPVEVR